VNALILVDLQNDFVLGGALPVAEGDQVVPLAGRLMPCFDLVVATKDSHPPDHLSFASQHPRSRIGETIKLDGLPQTLWPDHCVAGTRGAELVDGLDQTRIHRVFQKGTDRAIDSYSGFFDNRHRRSTGLGDFLDEQHVTDVFVMGLATDYCVMFTALDAVGLGFATHLILDGCRGVELRPGDVRRALDKIRAAGVRIIHSRDIIEGDMAANPG
jgi:nicotinamidase/pyrazinamidase